MPKRFSSLQAPAPASLYGFRNGVGKPGPLPQRWVPPQQPAARPGPASPVLQAPGPRPARTAPQRGGAADRKVAAGAQGARRGHFGFIDGLRALAAGQVVALHYCAAFLPVALRVPAVEHLAGERVLAHSPLFILVDGWFGLYLFFLISGFVLAQSFISSGLNPGQQAVKRYLRLWLPAAGAVVVGAGLLALMPHAGARAARISGSPWGVAFYRVPLSWAGVAKDAVLNSVLVGYRGSSIFSHLGGFSRLAVPPLTAALDPPVWALHVEIWGSIVLIGLAAAWRHLRRGGFWVLFVVALLALGTTWAGMMLLGFAAYLFRDRLLRAAGGLACACGLGCIVVGIYAATATAPGWATLAQRLLAHITLLQAPDTLQFQSFVGPALVFAGVALAAPVRHWLGNRLLVWLGSLSYAIYLLHFPVLFTVGSAVFAALAPQGYGFAFGVSLGAGCAVTLGLAVVFERLVDRPGGALARRAAAALCWDRAAPGSPGPRRSWLPAGDERPAGLDPAMETL